MSTTRVAIHVDSGDEHFGAHESGNYFVKDASPVTDDTAIGIDIGADISVYMTVGQWKALVGAVYLGIEAIPDKRQQRIDRDQRARARAAERVPAGVSA